MSGTSNTVNNVTTMAQERESETSPSVSHSAGSWEATLSTTSVGFHTSDLSPETGDTLCHYLADFSGHPQTGYTVPPARLETFGDQPRTAGQVLYPLFALPPTQPYGGSGTQPLRPSTNLSQ